MAHKQALPHRIELYAPYSRRMQELRVFACVISSRWSSVAKFNCVPALLRTRARNAARAIPTRRKPISGLNNRCKEDEEEHCNTYSSLSGCSRV